MIIKVKENFGSDLPFPVKLHEIWSVGSHEIPECVLQAIRFMTKYIACDHFVKGTCSHHNVLLCTVA